MHLKYTRHKSLIFLVSLVYLVFSCCYVTKCPKFGTLSAPAFKVHSTIQKAPTQAQKKTKHPAGTFMSRPRVISHDIKIPGTFCAIIILSCLFIGVYNKRDYYYPFIVHFKQLYCPDLVISLGNLKI
ncbi:hypothetical protein HYN43_024775 [Mucilaginibacter celer]|uniref:Lipoprotein n=1 Tax=Mucilaginibacter celer TaxID=2305508 RepID=A0A494VW44_9SPHI|nr:hypothetical protein HYN43_024775 [Mucilaginibacter celer]